MIWCQGSHGSTCVVAAIIGVCWISGTFVGFLPLFGWHRSQPTEGMQCLFTKVMDYNYLLFLYFATIVAPALLLAAFYAHIYRVVLNQVQYLHLFISFLHPFLIVLHECDHCDISGYECGHHQRSTRKL
jgi:hypothetical protein